MQCVVWSKILTWQRDRLLTKVTRPVFLGQQTLPWKSTCITIIAINLICPQDRLLKNVASPDQNEAVIGLEDRLLLTRWAQVNHVSKVPCSLDRSRNDHFISLLLVHLLALFKLVPFWERYSIALHAYTPGLPWDTVRSWSCFVEVFRLTWCL